MKTSEFIKTLQDTIEKYGDLSVVNKESYIIEKSDIEFFIYYREGKKKYEKLIRINI